jgi:iron complex outermembrane receptor protein
MTKPVFLVFNYLGYTPLEVEIAGRPVVDAVLEEDTRKIGEVVVTAFGIERQKRELGYSTEKIKGEEVLRANAPNLVNALSGKNGRRKHHPTQRRGRRYHPHRRTGQ